MTEPPKKKPPARSRQAKRPRAAAAMPTEPAPSASEPAPSAPLSMADRAARYRRPPPPAADRLDEAPRPAPVDLAERARRLNPHLQTTAASTAGADRPRQLDMAEIAARNRQARTAVREETLAAAAPPPRAPIDMAERAARHRRVVDDAPPAASAASMPTPPAAVAPVASAPAPSMADRAAEAIRKHRELREPTGQPPAAVEVAAQATQVAGSLAFVLVTRNHAGVLDGRLQAWRALLPAAGVRWLAVDLGSTDLTVAALAERHLQTVHLPGGLTTPLAAIDAAVRAAQADVVLIVDADAEPHPGVLALAEVVRAGHVAAVAPERQPVAMAVAAGRWLAARRADDRSALDGIARAGGLRRMAAGRQPTGHGVVARATEPSRWQRIQSAWREVQGLVRAFSGR